MSDETDILGQRELAPLLDSLQRHQVPVNLLSAHASAPEPSLLLASSPEQAQLIFDAPRNLNGGLYQPGTIITAMAVWRGAELRFDAEVTGTAQYQSYPALHTAWPAKIVTRQRRKAFRVRIGEDMSSRLDLYDESGNRIRGQLTDLSLGGFGALIDHKVPLSMGEGIDSALEIENDLSLFTSIELRAMRTPPKGRFMRIGASFTELTAKQQTQLERLLRALERHAIRAEGSQL